tara:strand:- start:18 stop:4220 length:4203 start_codon:yes stop_codon:yes gene_type:complete
MEIFSDTKYKIQSIGKYIFKKTLFEIFVDIDTIIKIFGDNDTKNKMISEFSFIKFLFNGDNTGIGSNFTLFLQSIKTKFNVKEIDGVKNRELKKILNNKLSRFTPLSLLYFLNLLNKEYGINIDFIESIIKKIGINPGNINSILENPIFNLNADYDETKENDNIINYIKLLPFNDTIKNEIINNYKSYIYSIYNGNIFFDLQGINARKTKLFYRDDHDKLYIFNTSKNIIKRVINWKNPISVNKEYIEKGGIFFSIENSLFGESIKIYDDSQFINNIKSGKEIKPRKINTFIYKLFESDNNIYEIINKDKDDHNSAIQNMKKQSKEKKSNKIEPIFNSNFKKIDNFNPFSQLLNTELVDSGEQPDPDESQEEKDYKKYSINKPIDTNFMCKIEYIYEDKLSDEKYEYENKLVYFLPYSQISLSQTQYKYKSLTIINEKMNEEYYNYDMKVTNIIYIFNFLKECVNNSIIYDGIYKYLIDIFGTNTEIDIKETIRLDLLNFLDILIENYKEKDQNDYKIILSNYSEIFNIIKLFLENTFILNYLTNRLDINWNYIYSFIFTFLDSKTFVNLSERSYNEYIRSCITPWELETWKYDYTGIGLINRKTNSPESENIDGTSYNIRSGLKNVYDYISLLYNFKNGLLSDKSKNINIEEWKLKVEKIINFKNNINKYLKNKTTTIQFAYNELIMMRKIINYDIGIINESLFYRDGKLKEKELVIACIKYNSIITNIDDKYDEICKIFNNKILYYQNLISYEIFIEEYYYNVNEFLKIIIPNIIRYVGLGDIGYDNNGDKERIHNLYSFIRGRDDDIEKFINSVNPVLNSIIREGIIDYLIKNVYDKIIQYEDSNLTSDEKRESLKEKINNEVFEKLNKMDINTLINNYGAIIFYMIKNKVYKMDMPLPLKKSIFYCIQLYSPYSKLHGYKIDGQLFDDYLCTEFISQSGGSEKIQNLPSMNKPDEEQPKQEAQLTKPDEEQPKPDKEQPKPEEEKPKQEEEQSKPEEEAPKPEEEQPKPEEEQPNPLDIGNISKEFEKYVPCNMLMTLNGDIIIGEKDDIYDTQKFGYSDIQPYIMMLRKEAEKIIYIDPDDLEISKIDTLKLHKEMAYNLVKKIGDVDNYSIKWFINLKYKLDFNNFFYYILFFKEEDIIGCLFYMIKLLFSKDLDIDFLNYLKHINNLHLTFFETYSILKCYHINDNIDISTLDTIYTNDNNIDIKRIQNYKTFIDEIRLINIDNASETVDYISNNIVTWIKSPINLLFNNTETKQKLYNIHNEGMNIKNSHILKDILIISIFYEFLIGYNIEYLDNKLEILLHREDKNYNVIKYQYDKIINYAVPNDYGNSEKLFSFLFNGVSGMSGGKRMIYNKLLDNLNNIDIINGYSKKKDKERRKYLKKMKKLQNKITK